MNLEHFVNVMGINIINAIEKIHNVKEGDIRKLEPDDYIDKDWYTKTYGHQQVLTSEVSRKWEAESTAVNPTNNNDVLKKEEERNEVAENKLIETAINKNCSEERVVLNNTTKEGKKQLFNSYNAIKTAKFSLDRTKKAKFEPDFQSSIWKREPKYCYYHCNANSFLSKKVKCYLHAIDLVWRQRQIMTYTYDNYILTKDFVDLFSKNRIEFVIPVLSDYYSQFSRNVFI